MTSIIVVASLTLLASFLCSLFEAALYSITPTGIGILRQRTPGPAVERLARLREDVEEPIAAILTINTVAHTVGAAWCGSMVGQKYDSAAVGIFAAVFTVLVLALTEIVPKSLGVRYARQLATSIVWPIQVMIWSVWPVVWIAKKAMGLITGSAVGHGPGEDEVVIVSRLAANRGALRAEEHRWVRNVLRLDLVTAGDLRTPRTVVETLPAETAVADLAQLSERWSHSRVPITEGGSADAVIGLVHRREAFDAALREPDADLILRDLMRPIRFVPETMPAHQLLELFLADRVHMVAVADEYGGFEGVVTLEDVLEQMLGSEIVDEHDRVDDMQALALARAAERQGERDDER
ncbi:Hemolysin C [Planctomycetes bacterium Pla163]|uniref:Hemolysin C n=1 Tax=Rohdeia mirabilis TaxID=2528008 RepID=A0A518CV58_9BACT|nr:Hemolysin C [Planctomycetes bacterium Pla163]